MALRIFGVFAAITLFFGIATPSTQARDWHYAETANFRIYAYDNRGDVEDFAIDLERLDQAMRLLSGIGPASEPTPYHSKVTIYRFGETRDIGMLVDNQYVGGFFISRPGQPVAFVPRRANRVRGLGQEASPFALNPRGVLYHEYAHYFMYNHAPAAYPAWFSEGFAELFYTIEFEDDRFVVGEPPATRAYELARVPVNTRVMFATGEEQDVMRVYGHGWLLSSHLLFNPERSGQLNTYLRQINAGQPSIEAAEQVFGDLDQLNRELNTYRRDNARLLRVPYYDTSEPEVSIRRLNPDEEAVIDIVIQSKAGVSEDEARGQIDDVEEVLAEFPESLPVLRAAIEVHFDAGNLDEAEALALRTLEIDTDDIVAATYLGQISMHRAGEDPGYYEEARDRLAAAADIDNTHPEVLHAYYRSFAVQGGMPPEYAAIALEQAFRSAPYGNNIRRSLAHLLLMEDRDAEALVVMGPVINNPHSRSGQRLREMFESDDPEVRERLMERLRPKPFGYEPPEDEGDEGED